jgi:hypothetical protein
VADVKESDGSTLRRKHWSRTRSGVRVELLFPTTSKEPAARGLTRALQLSSTNAIVLWRSKFPAESENVVFSHGVFVSEARVIMMGGGRALLEFPSH